MEHNTFFPPFEFIGFLKLLALFGASIFVFTLSYPLLIKEAEPNWLYKLLSNWLCKPFEIMGELADKYFLIGIIYPLLLLFFLMALAMNWMFMLVCGWFIVGIIVENIAFFIFGDGAITGIIMLVVIISPWVLLAWAAGSTNCSEKGPPDFDGY